MARMSEIAVPTGSLVVLIGVSGAGKSTFAARHFRPTQVLSSDAFRAIVADDPADQHASPAAFELLHLAVRRRLERRRLTVVDATNVSQRARRTLIAIARTTRRPVVAIVLDPPLATALTRNARRTDRTVSPDVIARQSMELIRTASTDDDLRSEGFSAVHRLTDPDAVTRLLAIRAGGRDQGGGTTAEPGTIPTRPAHRARVRRTDR